MFKTILIPLDGSENAEMVFPYAAEIASKYDSTIFLVTVSESAAPDSAHLYRTYLRHAKRKLRSQLEDWHITAEKATTQMKTAVLAGKPEREILNSAQENNAGLILLASRGSSDAGPWLLGHIAAKVLRATDRAVMLVRKPAEAEAMEQRKLLRQILVPLDGSKIGESALCYAVALAQQTGAELILLEVFEPVSTVGGSGITFKLPEDESVKKALDSYLGSVAEPLKDIGLKVTTEVLFGNAANKIMEYAEERGIDLIAISTHGKSGIGRWVFGSVTDKILHTGDVAVLVAHAKAEWPSCDIEE